jgi:hypothetical protein
MQHCFMPTTTLQGNQQVRRLYLISSNHHIAAFLAAQSCQVSLLAEQSADFVCFLTLTRAIHNVWITEQRREQGGRQCAFSSILQVGRTAVCDVAQHRFTLDA